MSEFQLFLKALGQPEYVHVLLNPLPLYGLGMGILALVLALLLKSRAARLVGLTIVVVACVSVWPVVRYGHGGYDRVYAMSYGDAQQWLDVHEKRAELGSLIFYLTALVALTAGVAEWKSPKAAVPLAIATLILALVASGLGGWIAHAGGKVRHSEFRDGPPPKPVDPHEHDHEH